MYMREHLLRNSNEIARHCQKLTSSIERDNNKRVERLHPDNGVDFLALRRSLNKIGIIPTTSTAYIPKSYGLKKRISWTLMSKLSAVINEAHLVHRLWIEATAHAVDLDKHIVSAVFSFKTPIELVMEKVSNNSKLRIFRCKPYLHNQKEVRRNRLEDRT